jgi:DNA-binding NarL/FixJ family response regulator
VTKRLIGRFALDQAEPPRASATLEGVTAREREVLVLIARGLSNNEIAARLYVSESTVKSHVRRLVLKLGARDRAQLVIAAYETGLVSATGPAA